MCLSRTAREAHTHTRTQTEEEEENGGGRKSFSLGARTAHGVLEHKRTEPPPRHRKLTRSLHTAVRFQQPNGRRLADD